MLQKVLMKNTAVIISILVLVFTTQGCGPEASAKGGANQAAGQATRPVAKPVPVAVASITTGDAASYYITTATLEAEHHAQILARTTGVILEMFQEEGDLVDKGQLLLQLEDGDQLLRVKQAELTLAKLEQEHTRQTRMQSAGFLSAQDFEVTENARNQAQAELEVARLNLSYTKVRAPFRGQIVRRHLDLGGQVQPGTALFEIMDVTPLLTKVHIPSNRMGHLSLGQEIHLHLDSSDTNLKGKVSLISPIVDPETGTVKITAEIHNYPPGIRAGDFAEVRVITDFRKDALLVPSVAVFEEQGKSIVFVATDGVAQRRVVEVGFVERGTTEIRDGIQPSDLIVVKGQRDLRDGASIEILDDSQAEPTPKSDGAISEVGS